MCYSAIVLDFTHALRPAVHRRALLIVALALLALWLYGLGVFVNQRAPFEAALPRRRQPPGELHNLSRWDLGPTIRASSYYADWLGHHHPLFLVDDRTSPDMVEKWASAESDAHPWVELLWREPHTLERVVLRHAGTVEGNDLTARRYHVACLQGAGRGPTVDVDSNTEAVASHDLHCDDARGVRIDFERNGKDIVRIFEVETWGR